MPKSKRALGSNLARVDATTDEEIARHMVEDDTPELTDAEWEQAEIWEGDRFIRRVGRPKGSGKKELVTLRLDREILDHFRASGPGWQTRLNDALKTTIPKGGVAQGPIVAVQFTGEGVAQGPMVATQFTGEATLANMTIAGKRVVLGPERRAAASRSGKARDRKEPTGTTTKPR
jgi:uncharacterized protein (DUF4415 family)